MPLIRELDTVRQEIHDYLTYPTWIAKQNQAVLDVVGDVGLELEVLALIEAEFHPSKMYLSELSGP